MKKLFSILLVIILTLSASACGKKQDNASTDSTQSSEQTDVLPEEKTSENSSEQSETATQTAAVNFFEPKTTISSDIPSAINGIDLSQGKKIKLGTCPASEALPKVLKPYENDLTAVYKGQKNSFDFLVCKADVADTETVKNYLMYKFGENYFTFDDTPRDSASNKLAVTSTDADGSPHYDYDSANIYFAVTVKYNAYFWQWSKSIADIANAILNENMTQKQAVATINSYICDNYSFGACNDDNCGYYFRNNLFLANNVGACRHYAVLFYDLCRYADITCGLVDGYAGRNGKEVAHRWNRAYIDGAVYYFDITWNDYYGNNTQYMFLTQAQISKDHREASLKKTPDSVC